MVDEYNTGNPVPSSAMPDAWDNNATIDKFVNSTEMIVVTRTGVERDTMAGMQKKFDDQLTQQRVDFDVQHLSQSDTFNISQNEREETFSRQLSEQESIFESSQADKENRFTSFLDSSGYVFLGEYQNGPLQFSARNQYIRYNNQYYRLNAATDVGFTTTGNTASSFANDVSHFVLMDGDTLRQDLSSYDGYKYIGRCPDIATLRTIEPTQSGQKIEVVSYNSGWGSTTTGPLGGGDFYYDANDKSTADNGITVFVTAGGARWKRVCSNQVIPLEWAGLVPGGDLSAPWQSAIDLVAAKAVLQNSGKNLPTIHISSGEYRMLTPVKYYNMVITNFIGDVRARSEITNNTPAVWVKGYPKFRDQQIPDKVWLGGCFNLIGPGRTANPNTIGIQVGNDINNYFSKDGTGEAKCWLSNFRVTQFGIGLALTGYDCYLTSFTDFRIGLNRTNVATVDTVIQNSGERISFINGTIWGGGEANGGVYVNNQQFDLQFYAVSFDFIRSFIVLGPRCGWSTILLDGCHFEGFTDYIVESLEEIASQNVFVKFQNSDFLPTGNYGDVIKPRNEPGRKLFNIARGVTILLDGLNNRVTELPVNNDLLLSNSESVRCRSIDRMIYPSIPSPAHIKNAGARFARETVGAVTNANTSLVDFRLGDQNGFPSLTVGTVNGANALIGTLASGTTTGYLEIRSTEVLPVDRVRRYMATAAIQYKTSTALVVVFVFRWLDANKALISTDTYQYNMGPAVTDTSAPNYAEGGERCIPSFIPYRNPPVGAVYMTPYLQISGIKSDINITNFMVGEV